VTPYPPGDMPLARSLRGEQVSRLDLFVANAQALQGRWLSVDATPLRAASGSIQGAVVVLRDATRVDRSVPAVEILSKVAEATADAVIVTDSAGRIEYVNPAFESATGYAHAEVVGRTPRILKSGAHSREFYEGLWSTLLDGRVFRGTLVNVKKSGELYFADQTITPVRNTAGRVTQIVSVGRDVTQLRRAAERENTLRLARSVQQRLFPARAPAVPGFDVAGATFAADMTGGDYYDFISLPDECLGILVADVSGHGFDSALLMAETRAVLRATAQTVSEPSAILGVVNRVLHADTEAQRFATLLLVRLHLPSRSITYSNAGHTPGYLLDSTGVVKHVLSATGLPLGIFPDSKYETGPSLPVDPGDTLVLLTDGVTECGVPEGELFGAERALQVIRRSLVAGASELTAELYRAVRDFETGPQRDDATAVVVKRLVEP
jgi:sigma-B regulation protein RsbU (phosphoserine phosphatase)